MATAEPAVVFCRDYQGTTEAPGTIRSDGRPVGLWWAEVSWAAESRPWFSALCASCEEVVAVSGKLRTVRTGFADHLRTVHV
ncbi:MAG: hypothetical protein J0J04_07905 [Microbacterium sp.]|uniref:hypothetical protein n=1 Tax=Microbacterium sp. TaxID=51671 RepID=UPI001AD20F70|nr:hypothetical protein [Microbacterium sp.]MBN9214723.1 hypothetical protein [Microbacterium sp.]